MPQQAVAHAFAGMMNGHDPDAVDGFGAEDYVNRGGDAVAGHLAGA